MNIPAELKYTKDHEWIRIEGDEAVIGITDFAQGELGDIVFVDIGTEGQEVDQHAVFGTVEAVKTVSAFFMPVKGTVTSVNTALADDPASVNKDPYGKGWMVRIKVSDKSQLAGLLTAEQYQGVVANRERMSRQWWFAGLWAFVILVLCLIPGRTLPQWHWFDLFNLDKLVHAGMFFVLTVLLAQALRVQGVRPRHFLPVAAGIGAFYGVLTEVLQRIEGMGRVMDPTDMVADAFGAIVAAGFMNWCLKRGKEYLPFTFLR